MQQLLDNRYRLLRPLGSGGMADVYLAHDDVLDRDVALKVMSSRYADDDEFVERFKREAQNAAALSHPNIVSIYDRGTSDDGSYYIAMEYLPGGTLKDEIVKRGALPARTAAAVALQIAGALQVAHRSGVVHRDIKPHNILITASGDIKVTDFGIARAASSSTMTKTGSILGTAHYISPEQAMGQHVGPQSDLYSLGVVLYEMLTGDLPYDADSPIGVAMKHVTGTPQPPVELDPSIPAGVNAITMRLLAKDPADRYANDAELMEDLERVSNGLQPSPATRKITRVAPVPGLPAGTQGRADTAEQTRVAPQPSYNGGRPGGRPVRESQGRLWILLPVAGVLILLASLIPFAWAGLQNSQNESRVVATPEEPLRNPPPGPPAEMLTVPDLDGMTLDEAREEHDEFEFVVEERRQGTQDEDTILEQNPAPDRRVRQEDNEIRVDIVGTRVADVPNVVDWNVEDARQAVEGNDFAANVEFRESSPEQEGLVMSQDPAGGRSIETGSSVGLVVGDGPALVTVPSVYNLTVDEARTELQNAGLTLGSVTRDYSEDVAEGRIFYQNVASGAEEEPGTAVPVLVSQGPEQITVPDVTGQDYQEAAGELLDAGLGVNREVALVTSEEPANTVLQTDPAPGEEVEPETIVTLVASSGPPEEEPEPEPEPEPTPPNRQPDGGGGSDPDAGSNGNGQPQSNQRQRQNNNAQEERRERRQEQRQNRNNNSGGNNSDDDD